MTSRRSPTIDAAGAAAAPTADSRGEETSERLLLERLKREVMELRYKVRRFEEIKVQVPTWRAKARRYDTLVRELIPVALLALIGWAQPTITWAARRRKSRLRAINLDRTVPR